MRWAGRILLALLANASPAGAVEIVTDTNPRQTIVANDSATGGFHRIDWPHASLADSESTTIAVADGRCSARSVWVNRDDELSVHFDFARAGTSPPDSSVASMDGLIQFRVGEPMRYELSGEMLVDDSGQGDLVFVEVSLNEVTPGRFGIAWHYEVDKRSEATPDEHFRFGLAGGDLIDTESGSLSGELLPVEPGNPYPDRRYELRYRIAMYDKRDDAGDVGSVATGSVVLKLTPFTPTPVPVLSATKRDTLAVDDGDERIEPGETVEYTIAVRNDGDAAAEGALLEDVLDDDVSLVVGSVSTSQGTVSVGNLAGDTEVEVQLGTIPPGDLAEVTFQVIVDAPLPEDVQQISNRARITGDNFGTVQTDDPDTAVADDDTLTFVANTPFDRCERDREQLEAEIAACIDDREALLADDDGDGVLDLVDACHGTTGGASTDALGCSQAEFCRDVGQGADSRRKLTCKLADWKNDEPLGARDCRWHDGACAPRSESRPPHRRQ